MCRHLCSERAAIYAPGAPLRVLEVGAGDGRLAYHLNAALRAAAEDGSVTLHATDSDARGLLAASPAGALVEVAPCDASLLARCAPHLVLACWPPFGVDWTALFRAAPSVREYVLLGEPDICGTPWETWGDARHLERGSSGSSGSSSGSSNGDSVDAGSASGSSSDEHAQRVPPYEADGFERVDLPALWRVQLCRTDERWRPRGVSRSVAFRRRRKADDDDA
jgi:hypothetical protein